MVNGLKYIMVFILLIIIVIRNFSPLTSKKSDGL